MVQGRILFHALLLFNQLHISFAYRNIGRVFLYKEQLDSAYYYFDKALHIADIKKYPSVSSMLLEVGVVHRSAGDYLYSWLFSNTSFAFK